MHTHPEYLIISKNTDGTKMFKVSKYECEPKNNNT
jgi:hypothetical protein